MWRRVALTAHLALSACTPAGVFVCSLDDNCSGGTCEANGFCSFSDGACPSGRRYGALAGNGLGGICVGQEPDAGVVPDGSLADGAPGPDGGTPAATCGTTDLIADDFETPARAPAWGYSFDNGAAVAAETGGRLVITLSTAGRFYAGYASELTYDLTGHAVTVEVVEVPNQATSAQGGMNLGHPTEGAVGFEVADGNLTALRRDGSGNQTPLASVAWSATAHRFWRISELGGQTIWETSPDRTSWMLRHQAANPIDFRRVRVTLLGGTYEAQASPGQMVFDNFNTGLPAAAFCAPESLVDRFEDGAIDATWDRTSTGTGCTIVETGGEVVLTPSTTAGSYCQLGTSTAFDLTGKAVLVRVPQMLNTATDAVAYLRLADFAAGPSHYVAFFQHSGMLLAQSRQGGAETDVATPWSATDHLWWRISEAGGMILWETSPDGLVWMMRRMSPNPIAVTQITVDLSAENASGAAAPGAAHFDDFNAPR